MQVWFKLSNRSPPRHISMFISIRADTARRLPSIPTHPAHRWCHDEPVNPMEIIFVRAGVHFRNCNGRRCSTSNEFADVYVRVRPESRAASGARSCAAIASSEARDGEVDGG